MLSSMTDTVWDFPEPKILVTQDVSIPCQRNYLVLHKPAPKREHSVLRWQMNIWPRNVSFGLTVFRYKRGSTGVSVSVL